jgi:hypothetical protein
MSQSTCRAVRFRAQTHDQLFCFFSSRRSHQTRPVTWLVVVAFIYLFSIMSSFLVILPSCLFFLSQICTVIEILFLIIFYFGFISPSSHEWLFCCILCLSYLFIFGLSHGTLVVPFSLIFPTTVRLFITLFFYFFLLFLEVGCVGIKKHCVWAFLLFL